MLSYRIRAIFLSLLLLTLGTPSQAQTDPQGFNHGVQLFESYYAGDSSTYAFLFTQNPALSKRAFLAALEYMGQQANINPQEAQLTKTFAEALAADIYNQFGDQVPVQIMTMNQQRRPKILWIVSAICPGPLSGLLRDSQYDNDHHHNDYNHKQQQQRRINGDDMAKTRPELQTSPKSRYLWSGLSTPN